MDSMYAIIGAGNTLQRNTVFFLEILYLKRHSKIPPVQIIITHLNFTRKFRKTKRYLLVNM